MPSTTLWKLKDGRVIRLLTLDDLKYTPNGTELISIMGERVVKGQDYIDLDTRGLFIAYGLLTGN